MKTQKEIQEIMKNFKIPNHKGIEIINEKNILEFFKLIELDNLKRRDHFNFRYIINEGLQKIKLYLIKNYFQLENRSDIEQLFDNIIEIILEVLQTNGNNLEIELIYKILNLESEIVDFLSCCT